MPRSRAQSRVADETSSGPSGGGGIKWRAFLFTLIALVCVEIGVVMYAGLGTTNHVVNIRAQYVDRYKTILELQTYLGLATEGDNTTTNTSANLTTYDMYLDNNNTLSLEGFGLMYREMCEKYFIPRTIRAGQTFQDVFLKISVANGKELPEGQAPPPAGEEQAGRAGDLAAGNTDDRPLCDCVPHTLVGQSAVSFTVPYLGELELTQPQIRPGGHWDPPNCLARHRTAIIIPFRDRAEHLTILLNHLHKILQAQQIYYTVFVIEQVYPAIFNKASIMNVGFREASSQDSFDCFVFHDVDMIPENDFNFYTCTPQPRHVGSHVDKFHYKIPYPGIFGGVTAFTGTQFIKVNGFSNEFYGWGGEDDDMYQRVKASGLNITRFPSNVARYSMIKHGSDAGNPYNSRSYIAWSSRPTQYKENGLSTLRYYRRTLDLRPLYTWVLVELPDARPIDTSKGAQKASQSCPRLHRPSAVPYVYLVLLVLVITNGLSS